MMISCKENISRRTFWRLSRSIEDNQFVIVFPFFAIIVVSENGEW